MDEDLLDVATRIIRQANLNGVPADDELRLYFRHHHDFARRHSAEVSRMVFTFYRWSQFANPKDSLAAKVRFSNLRAAAFAQDPGSFSIRALKLAVPKWVGREMDLEYEWLAAIQRDPVLWVRARKGMAETVREALHMKPSTDSGYDEAMIYRGRLDLFRQAGFRNGDFEIQDISSQLVGHVCNPQPKETWWDACCGEGGKTLHLSDLMENKGLIWATDRSKRRLGLLKKRAAKGKAFNVRIRSWDGGDHPPVKTKFDGVLVDAPCSGVGTWQRNPHARWTTTEKDVAELAEIQVRLLANVARNVKRGGKLIYSVCTLTQSETEDVVAAFSKRFPEFEPLDLSYAGMKGEPASSLTVWPQHQGGNGMFVAGWKRAEEEA